MPFYRFLKNPEINSASFVQCTIWVMVEQFWILPTLTLSIVGNPFFYSVGNLGCLLCRYFPYSCYRLTMLLLEEITLQAQLLKNVVPI